ncbi:MAG: [citrate (pro-3S)-lyase] ligase [Lachnospiraceae bacterium]|nr:[citrate (pro-3S)-lyase] ligase [Lachnospiraceae bacterium]
MLEGRPFKGSELEQLKQFLKKMDLEYDDGIEYSICMVNEDYEIIATGSVEENVLKCIAIDPSCQGQGLSGTILSQLIQYEFEHGRSHILMYTKPKNQAMFEDLGFHTIIKTTDVLFMENKRDGFSKFMTQVKAETPEEASSACLCIGAIVANCNPFTLGHRYLIEQALTQCDWLHLFVLSDKRTFYSAQDRFEMVKAGIADLDRVILHRTSDYMISAATFPTYFMKEKAQAKKANCRLDLELFANRIAPELGIRKRFVGTEPNCLVTDCYNDTMKELLPEYDIEVVEILRKETEGQPISASRVREAVKEGRFSDIQDMVPESTYRYLLEKQS